MEGKEESEGARGEKRTKDPMQTSQYHVYLIYIKCYICIYVCAQRT